MEETAAVAAPMWELQVKLGAATHTVALPADQCTGSKLLAVVAEATGTLARNLKLIHKGRVLGAGRLEDQGVSDGAKLMALGGSMAGTSSTAGAKVASAISQAKAVEAKARLQAHFAAARGAEGTCTPRAVDGATGGSWGLEGTGVGRVGTGVMHLAERQRVWRATGILMLRELGLTNLPCTLLQQHQQQEVVTPSSAARQQLDGRSSTADDERAAWASWSGALRAVDVCCNALIAFPSAVAALGASLASLKLSHNQLSDQGVPWEALSALQGLAYLALDHNQLTTLGPAHGGWMLVCGPRLRVLEVSHNQLAALPTDLVALTHLEVLRLDSNCLSSLPDELGYCVGLVDLSAQNNRILGVPAALRTCTKLECLRLEGNRVSSIPPGLLCGLSCLWLLQLGGNPITVEQLREAEGYKALDERRRARATKQIEGRVMLDGSSALTEGADAQEFNHWRL